MIACLFLTLPLALFYYCCAYTGVILFYYCCVHSLYRCDYKSCKIMQCIISQACVMPVLMKVVILYGALLVVRPRVCRLGFSAMSEDKNKKPIDEKHTEVSFRSREK